MTMAMTAYRTKGLDSRTQAITIINGFQGQLKYWWDNFLTEEHNKILDFKRVTRNSNGIEVEESAAAALLIHTITLHFLGNPKEDQASVKSILINLRCPTLSDYRWYKDVFLTNVLKREDGHQQFWKERFIAGLFRLFGERILNRLRQNFATNNIPFNSLTFGQLFGIIKSEGLTLCNELKLQAKYGADRAQSRQEMGNFCEAFGFEKIEAPSTKRKRFHNRKGKQKKPPFQPKEVSQSKPTPFTKRKTKQNKNNSKKQTQPIICYKCGQAGHKSNQCKMKQKINELFADDSQMQSKLLALLLSNNSDKSDNDVDYYSNSQDESEYESSPLPTINMITNKNQKKFLLDLIGQISDGDVKKEYLQKLKILILEEEDKTPKFTLNTPSSSLTNIYKQFPIPNPFQQITTKELQQEINQIKGEIKYLKNEVINLKTNDLTIEAKLALLQLPPQQSEIPSTVPIEISNISEKEIPTNQFIQMISKITFQKWFSIVTLIVEDFSKDLVALIDSGADVNCIKKGIVPTKYCEKSNEGLASANGSALHISYKLNKGYIKADGYCFKNTFLIVDNMTSDLILGTPFLTQIYPFYVNEIGLHTKIMGKTISFTFLTKQEETAYLQSSSIFKQINMITSLQNELTYRRIYEPGTLFSKALQQSQKQWVLQHDKSLPIPEAFRIATTNACDIDDKDIYAKLPRHVSIKIMAWSATKISFHSKEILAIVLCISKIQGNLLIKTFAVQINCKTAKEIFQEKIQDLVAQQIFERWQILLPNCNFEIEFVQGIQNVLPKFLTREFWQETSDTNISVQKQKMSSSKNKNKKDKGKAIQTADDYQLQIPVQNQFTPLAQTQFPPLPYKTVATNSNSSSSTNEYIIRFTEHILLTSCKPPPPNTIIPSITQKTFGPHQFATDDLRKSQKFYELILVDTQSVSITHTFDKHHPKQILYSKCIIRDVITAQQWKDPFEERRFSISYNPQTYNYNDYKNAWYRVFLLQPNIHSWFLNFHEQCSNTFPVWFYHWWTMFGCLTNLLPAEAKEGWDYWSQASTHLEPYMKEVLFFKQFNVAWIFSWEYRLQPFLPNPYPLSFVRIYKVKWWIEFKTKLCGKENVEHFCRTNKKKFTLHNLHLFTPKAIAPATPSKKESKEQSSSSSTKLKPKGLSQKERDLLEYLKDDPSMKQIVLQKILDKQVDSDDETMSSASSSSPPKPEDFQDSQDPYEL